MPLENIEKNIKNIKSKILLEVNKPSRYAGNEIGSSAKIWSDSAVKVALAFPDLYEIGISNLGLRILYHIINNQKNYLADRIYAPEDDFKQKLKEFNIPLFGLESEKPLSEFDVIAFSLQYELSYPTLLAMLDMGDIPIKNIDRNESHPIVMAGGPGCYNPETISDFIDVFIIGDGEDVIVEILDTIDNCKKENLSRIETLEKLAQIDGIYVPYFYKPEQKFSSPKRIKNSVPEKIVKRISQFKNETAPINFPMPYVSSVHDRAVIEIRRGCGRMCRFCQPCFVNLPIRERDANDIIDITGKVLKETGYEEYSLLSLSSNDYKGIETLVEELNNRHACNQTSISLPSQRADAFSLELAHQVQSVRKSTITFAAEAGSQRLRDTINKNLTEEQILNAVMSVYKEGWSSVKLYFMIGLPTETFEDLDEMLKLLQKIKDKSKTLKNELNLKKHLDITCTVSIFVPKPFTPFQWCAQDNIETMTEKIKYLREKAKYLKGVKLNYHDEFLTQLEAVFSRGDRNLNILIEKVYEKGSYLDAWHEHFNKNLWIETSQELGIDFEDYSCKNIKLDSELPWDIIEIGVKKEWLKNEYNKALAFTTTNPCDEGCNNCGVCKNLNITPLFNNSKINTCEKRERILPEKVFRYRLKTLKIGDLKYISHLDWQKLIYKAVRKAGIDVAFTQGFNPSPKISLGTALPLFVESNEEYIDIELNLDMNEIDLMNKLNEKLPEESKIVNIVKISKDVKALDNTVHWAKYSATPVDYLITKDVNLKCSINDFIQAESFFIEKTNKKGLKNKIDIKPSVYSINLIEEKDHFKLEFILRTGQGKEDVGVSFNQKPVSLRADEFLKVLYPDIHWNIVREKLTDENFKELVKF